MAFIAARRATCEADARKAALLATALSVPHAFLLLGPVFIARVLWAPEIADPKVYHYFLSAWGEFVLPFLKHSLEAGPIDWNNPPQKLEKAVLIK